MKRLIHLYLPILALFAGLVLGETNQAIAQQTFTVTITNATRGEVITPPVVIVHNKNFRLFSVGDPAIPELAALAEDGVTDGLTALLDASPDVYNYAVASDGIPPGESITVEVEGAGNFRYLTTLGMLATSNDAFFAVQGYKWTQSGSSMVYGLAYDAGSETNNESCDYIPGPPCGNPMVRDTSGAEGYVHVHAGIHGIGDLAPAEFDWRNPVAMVEIQKAGSK